MDWKWFLLVFFFLGCDCNKDSDTVVIGSSIAVGTISIGYLMDQTTPPYRIGAISLGVEDGQRNGLLRNYNFR
jgi:hypothetical protein